MKCRVLLFASYADALGGDSVEIDLPEPVRVRDVLAAVKARATRPVPAAPLVAVNAAYADAEQTVGARDEVAIIPPVAGG
jgi:molybdopterin converting factor small subunit